MGRGVGIRTSLIALGLGLTLAPGTLASAHDADASVGPSVSPSAVDEPDVALGDGFGWAPVVHSERGPGEAWIEHGLGGVVTVLQPDDGTAEAWRSSHGVEWEPIELPDEVGVVSDVVPLLGGVALITDEARSDEAWSFDVWTSEDGLDWQLASSQVLEPHPDLADRHRSVLGFRSVEAGIVAFESYSMESDATTPAALEDEPRPGRVFAWQALIDGETWERHEVEGLGRAAIGSGARIFEGDRQQLYVVQPGLPPRLLVSTSGVRWDDLGALSHGLDDPQGAAAIERIRDGFLVAGRPHASGPEPEPDTVSISRGTLGGHWVHVLTVPDLEVGELFVDRNVAIVVGTTRSGGTDRVGPRRSFVATSSDRGRTWKEQTGSAEQELCLGPLARIGDVVLLGSGCLPTGGMAILSADLDAFDDEGELPTTSSVSSAPQALDCDFTRSRQDSGEGDWEGDPGYDSPLQAMEAAVRQFWVIPKSGYHELARDEAAVLYGYRNAGEVKVAVRVVAVRGAEDDWLPERLSSCRLAEFGAQADMGRGVWLWANRRDRTIQERRGPAHCDWQSTRFLYWLRPDDPETLRATRLYVRDPKGIFRDMWKVAFLRNTSLPPDARHTGYRRDSATLWMAADERAMYVKDGDRVERWPRIPSGTGCA